VPQWLRFWDGQEETVWGKIGLKRGKTGSMWSQIMLVPEEENLTGYV
jgi:hypothetical protein